MASQSGSKTKAFKRGNYDFYDILQAPPVPEVVGDEYGAPASPKRPESPPPPGSSKSLKSCDIHLKKQDLWKKKKVKKITPTWTSQEYRFAAVDPNAPGFKAPDFKPPRVSIEENYLSSQYKVETKKKSEHPYESQKGAYLSKEYQKDYPTPPMSYPDVPLGFTPADGPWVQCFDSMWNPIWVSLKDLDVAEAKKEDWTGFDWRKDHIA